MRLVARHEGGGGAADRARRYRRRLGGDAVDARADRFADTAVGGACAFSLAAAARDGQLAPRIPTIPEAGSGYVVLAIGKMGAFELNYSSDIDLIVFYDPDAPACRGRRARAAIRAHHTASS